MTEGDDDRRRTVRPATGRQDRNAAPRVGRDRQPPPEADAAEDDENALPPHRVPPRGAAYYARKRSRTDIAGCLPFVLGAGIIGGLLLFLLGMLPDQELDDAPMFLEPEETEAMDEEAPPE